MYHAYVSQDLRIVRPPEEFWEKTSDFAFGFWFSTFWDPICIKIVALDSPVSPLFKTAWFFLKTIYGARSNLDFTCCTVKIEDPGLQWKFTIGFHTAKVVQCMEYHTFCWFYLVFSIKFQSTKNKIKITPSSISIFQNARDTGLSNATICIANGSQKVENQNPNAKL